MNGDKNNFHVQNSKNTLFPYTSFIFIMHADSHSHNWDSHRIKHCTGITDTVSSIEKLNNPSELPGISQKVRWKESEVDPSLSPRKRKTNKKTRFHLAETRFYLELYLLNILPPYLLEAPYWFYYYRNTLKTKSFPTSECVCIII